MRRIIIIAVILLASSGGRADQGWQDNQFEGGFYLYDYPAPLQLRGGVTTTVCKIGEITPFGYSPTLQCTSMDQMEFAYDGGVHLNSLGLADLWLQSLSERVPLDSEPISDWNTGGQVSGYYVRGPTYTFTTGASTNTEGIGLWTFGQPTFSSISPATAVSLQNATFYVPTVSNITAAGPYGIRVVSGSTAVGVEVDGTYQAAGLGGSGTRCVQVDNTGKMELAAGACGSGSGTVTSVTGTTGRIVVAPATPNPAVDLATFGTASTCAWANVITDAWGRTTCTANTAPQPAGNYMTAVTHDAIGSGPGSTSVEVVGVTDGTSVDHPVAASAWTNGQALAIDGSAAIHTVPFQAPLTACTDYVSVSCQGVSSDISNTNTNVEVDAFHDFGGQRWTYGTLSDGDFARFDVGGGKFVASGSIAGDGTTLSCSNSGIPPENLVCSQIGAGKVLVSATDPTRDYLDTKLESTSANIAVTHISGPPEFVNLNVVTAGLFDGPQTVSISTNYVTYAPTTIGYGNHSIPYATARSTADVQNDAMEVPVGFAATHQRVLAWVTSNSLSSTGGGSSSTACSPSQNGFSTSIFAGGVGGIPNTSTGLFDSGVQSVSSPATTDTWGIICGGTSPLSGSITMTVTVILYR